jgi:peptide/nickel transport system permease protein
MAIEPHVPIEVSAPSSRRLAGFARSSAARLWRRPGVLAAWIVLTAIVLAVVGAPILAVSDPSFITVSARLQPPGGGWLMGTDNFGRDILARVLYGGRASLSIGLAVVILAVGGGSVVGLLAGYNRRFDAFAMRIVDGLISFPALVLAIGMVGVLGPGATTVILALSIVYAPRVVRIVRGSVLVAKEQPFVEATVSLGAGNGYIIRHHLLPSVWSPIIVQASFIFSFAVLGEAALSFLGVGVPADVPSWGNILTDARAYLDTAWWMSLFPGLTIVATVLTLNVIGDDLRDAMDPTLRGR